MAYSLSFSLAAAAGVQGGLAVVTDYRGNTGSYVFRAAERNNRPKIAPDMGAGFEARQGAHSPDYVTLAATQKPAPETRKMG